MKLFFLRMPHGTSRGNIVHVSRRNSISLEHSLRVNNKTQGRVEVRILSCARVALWCLCFLCPSTVFRSFPATRAQADLAECARLSPRLLLVAFGKSHMASFVMPSAAGVLSKRRKPLVSPYSQTSRLISPFVNLRHSILCTIICRAKVRRPLSH